MTFILDSSVALSWCFSDEATPASLKALALATTETLLVPSLWHVEMCNVLGLAFRRRRLHELDLSAALKVFANLDLHTDITFAPLSSSFLLSIMQAYSLTAYDAVYLELAMRNNLPLATFDQQLASAAVQSGVTLLCQPE